MQTSLSKRSNNYITQESAFCAKIGSTEPNPYTEQERVMQKSLIILVVGLLAIGCGKTLEEKVIGEYQFIDQDGDNRKAVFLSNWIVMSYFNGEKQEDDYKWEIVNEEIHIDEDGDILVFRINKDKSIISVLVPVQKIITTINKT